MMAEDPTKSFKASLKEHFNVATFSDAVIQCGDKKFHAHRLILSAHSTFFSKMLTGNWKESDSKAITLGEVDDAVVEAMLHFMYHFDYSNTQGVSAMVFHAQVYSIADKYMIPALQHLAKTKFKAAIQTGWSMDDFPLAVAQAYGATPEDDRGLRDLVVEICRTNSKRLLENDNFLDVLKENPCLAVDLAKALSGSVKEEKESTGTKTYICPNCQKPIKVKWEHGANYSYYCIHCGSRRANWGAYLS